MEADREGGYEWLEATVNKGAEGLGMEMELDPPFGGRAVENDSRSDREMAVVVISGFVVYPDGHKGAAEACGMLRKGDIVEAINGQSIAPGCAIGDVAARYLLIYHTGLI